MGAHPTVQKIISATFGGAALAVPTRFSDSLLDSIFDLSRRVADLALVLQVVSLLRVQFPASPSQADHVSLYFNNIPSMPSHVLP